MCNTDYNCINYTKDDVSYSKYNTLNECKQDCYE